MAGSDAILVGEDWISEHYFTTDAKKQSFHARVLERRKVWEEDKAVGTVRSRFTERRAGLLDSMTVLGPDQDDATQELATRDLAKRLVDVLGLAGTGLHHEVAGPVTYISSVGLPDTAPLVLLEAVAVDGIEALLRKDDPTLITPFDLDDKTQLISVARTLSALFVSESAPAFALVLAGRMALVAERERWAEGRYLAVDLQVVCERNDDKRGGEVDRALTCLSAESLAPDAEGSIWWHDTLSDSIKHTVGVSQDLREGVRLSIEIIANDVVVRRQRAGLDPLPAGDAQTLAKQSLRFLYRILFLLFAEASPELGVLPTGATEYDRGYSLDRLRELTLTELATVQGQQGTHLYESLAVLFRLIDRGHEAHANPDDESEHAGLEFRSLRADLFRPEATALIDAVRLSNQALQRVLQHLLLSKEIKGKDRGFISYAELGINQLGAVYEGLMSYTGFFAETDLYEVAKGGDGSKGSWVVPVTRADGLSAADFIKAVDPVTGESKPVLHERGAFVFRLAGRERQQSASYYTPEVLTKFVVSQALEELLDQDGHTTTAAEILTLTVCEPALGSGAFAIEAVRQLAEQYLRRRQDEVGRRIDPDQYPRELQRTKTYLALHQVYGVDLNATAVELAEISLWLDTMVEGLSAPWFGLHLRRGNSLIGARRAVFTREQVNSKAWLKAVPTDVPLTDMADTVAQGGAGSGAGRIHHFLLPAEGWGSAVDSKEAKNLAPEALGRLKTWRRSILARPTKKQTDDLIELGHRVEKLWQISWRRLEIAEQEIRRDVAVWEADLPSSGGTVSREDIEERLSDPAGAYQRLRRVMDAWTAMWFWPLTDRLTTELIDGETVRIAPPSLDDWISTLQGLLGRKPELRKRGSSDQDTLGAGATWDELNAAEEFDLGFAGAQSVDSVLASNRWLSVAQQVSAQQGFFHWDLDFAAVVAQGGFDLQLGNPPWVRPDADVSALLAESDPWWQLTVKPTQVQMAAKRQETLALPGAADLLVEGTSDLTSLAAFLRSPQQYPYLEGLRPDLYRCFMEQAWRHQSALGMTGLIHPETHFTEEKAGRLRAATYGRLRRHWQFMNSLFLFEVHDQVSYGIHVYGSGRVATGFLMATSLYHPDTVERSLVHDGSGGEPGLRDPDGNWDLRPHRNRIIKVTEETLATWHAVLEGDAVPVRQSRMVYTVNRATAAVLDKLSVSPRMGDLGLEFSGGWNETTDRQKGFFENEWGTPDCWDDVILQGPHLFVSTPIYKTPNKTMLHNQDWSATDFETLAPDAIPVTAYKPAGSRARYNASYTHWGASGEIAARDQYRVAWRRMAANTGVRTLIAAVIPPGATHVNTVHTFGLPHRSNREFMLAAAFASSLIADFCVRAVPKSEILFSTVARLPFVLTSRWESAILLRALRLNCVTAVYSNLWHSAWDADFASDSWTTSDSRLGLLSSEQSSWSPSVPLRLAIERRQAQVELDALVALSLGLSADELCTVYRTQFPVLYGYDRHSSLYDADGRLVPNTVISKWRTRQVALSEDERTSGDQTYKLPFATLDREADLRVAYSQFEERATES